MAEVLIDFQINQTSLNSALDQLEQFGEVDAKNAAEFKKTNAELNSRATTAKKVGNELKSPVKELDNLEKKTKKFASEFEKAIEAGVMDALRDMNLDIDTVRKRFEELAKGGSKANDQLESKVKDLNDELTKTRSEVEKLKKKLEENAGKPTQANETLRKKLREVTQELQALQLSGEQNSERYKELILLSGQYGDAIDEVNNQIKNSRDGERTINGLVNAAQSLTGAFVGVQGAMALFGDESEDTQKALLKLNGAMAVLQGLQAVITGLQSDGAITLAVLNLRQKVSIVQTNLEVAAQSKNIVVKKAAAAAQWLLNAAMAANPIGILVAALVAVAAALVVYTRNSRNAAEATGELRGAVRNLTEELDKSAEAINRNAEREILDLERAGAKQSEIIGVRVAALRNQILANEEAYRRNKDILDKGLGDEEDRQNAAQALEEVRRKNVQLRIDLQRLQFEQEKQLEEERKALIEEQKKRESENLEAQKKRIADSIARLKTEQLQVDEGTLTYNRLQAAIVTLQGKYDALGVSAAQSAFAIANAAKEAEKLTRDQSSAIDATLNQTEKRVIDTSKALRGIAAASINTIKTQVQETEDAFQNFIDNIIPKINQGLTALQSLSQGLSSISQERQNNQQIEIENQRRVVDELLEAGAITEKEAIERQKRIDRIESIQRTKAAQQAKQLAIFQAIISTAQAVVNALATPPAPVGIALAAVVGAIGAAQIAAIASRPIPKFAKGKKDRYEGPGIVGEAGAELIQKDGRMYIASKPTLIHLAAQDKVFTARETKMMLPTVDKAAMKPIPQKDFDYSKIAAMVPKTNNSVSINIDKEFISEAVANGMIVNNYFGRRYSSK